MTGLRRGVATAALTALLAGCGGTTATPARDPAPAPSSDPEVGVIAERLRDLERTSGARIGVHLEGAGRALSYRADVRMPHASAFKALLAGVVLDRATPDALAERVTWTAADLVDNSPVTERHVDDGLTVRELLGAMLLESDNTAANLLMAEVGGPAGLQRELRAVGDDVIRTSRYETELNTAVPGDPRDTSTPASLARSLRELLLGDALDWADRSLLEGLMRRTTTTAGLVRAAVPDDWVVADRSGAAAYGTRTVVALVRPPGEEPFVISVMTTHPDDPDAEWSDELVADAARIVLDELATR